MRLSPSADVLRVLRAAREPMPRAAIYERTRIDDIMVMDVALAELVRTRVVQRAGDATYRLTNRRAT